MDLSRLNGKLTMATRDLLYNAISEAEADLFNKYEEKARKNIENTGSISWSDIVKEASLSGEYTSLFKLLIAIRDIRPVEFDIYGVEDDKK